MTIRGIWELKKIAMRNLARHKTKTYLTCAAIMVSVAVYIFISSWLGGMAIESRRNIVNFEMGAAKLQTKEYFEKKDEMPSYETFMNWEVYREALSREGYVSTPRYTFTGTLMSTSGSAPVMIYAVDTDGEREVFRYVPYVDFGRYPEDGMFEIAIGTVAAEKLKVGIPTRPFRQELEELISVVVQNQADANFIRSLYNIAPVATGVFAMQEEVAAGNERMILDRNASKADLDRFWDLLAAAGRNNIRITTTIDIKDERGNVANIYQILDVLVVGVINSPAPLPNGNTAYIPLSALQDETGMMLQGAVTELVIRERGVPDTRLPGASESSAAITAALQSGLQSMGRQLPNDLGVRTWDEYMVEYLGYEAIQTGAPQIMVFFLLLLSFLGISNTILLAILERTREIGMMRAMGMTDGQMTITYMLETGFLGFIGSILGIILGCIINYPVVKYGFDFIAMAETLEGGIGFRTTGIFRSVWNIPVIFGSGIAATLLSSCIAFLPIRKALKMQITESMRFD